jgi:hypothetical protein
LHLFRLAGETVLHLFANDFCRTRQQCDHVGCRATSGCDDQRQGVLGVTDRPCVSY